MPYTPKFGGTMAFRENRDGAVIEYFAIDVDGFSCAMTYAHEFGHFCGYVDVPKDYKIASMKNARIQKHVNVHGGVSYVSDKFPTDAIGKASGMVIGFDCQHGCDRPHPDSKIGKTWEPGPFEAVFRDKEYVMNEIIGMVEQIKKIGKIDEVK
jgi:hypothetical protein